MPLGGDTTTTTTTIPPIMENTSNQGDSLVAPNHVPNITTSSHSIDHEFNSSQCLFCNQINSDLDLNLDHMSKSHGLRIDPANLLVDIDTLLAYLHFVISEYYECLYCGTQRNTRQAVQQHMMGKGHCRYDMTDENAEIRDFYDSSSSDSDANEDARRRLVRMSGNSHIPPKARSRKSRHSKRPDRNTSDMLESQDDQTSPAETPGPEDTEGPSRPSGALSARALKQEVTHDKQLSRLRADDLRSLMHLPVSQQRALLATHHKQEEKARRTEQVRRSNLERAGNHTNCLDKIRLVRKPPHTGNVHSLNR